MPRLTDDFVAVLDEVSPDEPVHLLAHDWGAIQSWPALVDPRVSGRVLSFTSISGPSLDHAGAYLRAAPRHPRAAARQLLSSYYVVLFQLPVLPELAARSGRIDRVSRRLAERSDGTAGGSAYFDERSAEDSLYGINLYRANMLPRVGRPRPERIDIPVQVIAPERDPHVSVGLQTEAPAPYVADLTVRVIAGGHWVVAQRPERIARYVEEFVAGVEARVNRAAVPSRPGTPPG
jgi:pimeloyl-ACP methyl ester carboxylesterase